MINVMHPFGAGSIIGYSITSRFHRCEFNVKYLTEVPSIVGSQQSMLPLSNTEWCISVAKRTRLRV